MLAGTWPNAPHADEYAVCFDRGRDLRLLVVPALFDEANKLRHFTLAVMRALDAAGVDTMLPDLPGTNESTEALPAQTLESWRAAMARAAQQFGASHALCLRGGCLCAPEGLAAMRYAPVTGASLLRAMLRARVIAEREAGREATRDALLAAGLAEGLVLAGHRLGAAMVKALENAVQPPAAMPDIAQSDLGRPGLWLRAEPDHDPAQAIMLAHLVRERLG